MSLEDRIRSTVDHAITPLVQQLLQASAADREHAIQAARAAIVEEAERSAEARIAVAEVKLRATVDAQIEHARHEDRAVAAREIRQQLEADVAQKMDQAVEAVETRMRIALADGEARAAAELQAAVADARVKQREIEMAAVTRLLESVRGLDGATSLSEVFDALALAAAREAARAAVLVLRNDRIQGWKMSGFGQRDTQPKSIDLTLAEAGVIGMAIGAARTVTTRDSQTAAVGPGFETLPADRMGLAVPVIVGGRVVAVVYADAVAVDAQQRLVPGSWPELIEVLARHAGRCLEALTSQKTTSPRMSGSAGAAGAAAASGAAGASTPVGPAAMMQATDGLGVAAQRTARLLVADIRLFHERAVNEGRQDRNLLVRLGPQISQARDAYNRQVTPDVRSQTDYFAQELIRTLAGGDATLLGNLA